MKSIGIVTGLLIGWMASPSLAGGLMDPQEMEAIAAQPIQVVGFDGEVSGTFSNLQEFSSWVRFPRTCFNIGVLDDPCGPCNTAQQAVTVGSRRSIRTESQRARCDVFQQQSAPIDFLHFNHLFRASDYTPSRNPSSSACSPCGGNSGSASSMGHGPSVDVVRTHRFRDMTKQSSFGPGAFWRYDISLQFSSSRIYYGTAYTIQLFDPFSINEYNLVGGHGVGTRGDGRYSIHTAFSRTSQAVDHLQLLDAAGNPADSQRQAKQALLLNRHGERFHFDIMDVSDRRPNWIADSNRGQVVELDEQWIRVPGYQGILGNASRTVSAWVKGRGTVLYWGQGNDWRIQVNSGGRLQVRAGEGSIEGSRSLSQDRWHHVTVVLPDGVDNVTDILLYVDGQPEPIRASQSATINTAAGDDLTIGSRDSEEQFVGQLDDIHLYSQPLAPNEVANLYGGVNTPGLSNGLEGHWQFDHTSGILASDHSTHGRHGVVENIVPEQVGRLTRIEDRNGLGVNIRYRYNFDEALQETLVDPSVVSEPLGAMVQSPIRQWQIDTVTDSQNRTISVEYGSQQVGGRWAIEKLVLPSGDEVHYGYDGHMFADAQHADGSGSHVRYGVSDDKVIVQYDDASASASQRRQTLFLTASAGIGDSVSLENTSQIYAQPSLLVQGVINGEGELEYAIKADSLWVRQIYQGGGRLAFQSGWVYTQYYTQWDIDDDGFIVGDREPTYARNSIYDLDVDIDNVQYQYQTDSHGFPTKKTYSDDSYEHWTYNAFKQLTRYEDRLGQVTRYTYDDRGNLLTREVGLRRIGGTDADPNDVPQAEHAIYTKTYYPESHAQAFLLESEIDANGNVTKYFYNENHFVQRIEKQDDNGSGFYVAGSFTYDQAGRLASSTGAMGRVTTYQYDARSRTVGMTYNDGSREETLYGAGGSGLENLVVARKDRNGNVSTMAYDNQGRLTQAVTGHDNVGPSGSILDGYAIPTSIPSDAGVSTCSYLNGTNLRSECTVRGETTRYFYDYRHRLVETRVQPHEGTELVSRSQYVNNRLFSRTDPYGRKTFYAYRSSDSALIRTVQATLPNPANEPTTFNQVLDMVRSGSPDTPDPNAQYLITDLILNESGQRIARIDPRSIVHATAYDSRGRTVLSAEAAATLPPYNEGTFDPTDDSQLQDITAKTVTLYDANSNVIEVQHPRYFDSSDSEGFGKCNTTRTYSHRNLLLSQTVAAGAPDYIEGDVDAVRVTESFTYYPDGRRKTRTDFRGNVSETLWHQCCGRPQGSVDPAGHGTLSNNDFYGNVTHTATVEGLSTILDTNGNGLVIVSGAASTGAHDPPNAKTLSETTSRYDNRNRLIARTVWLAPLDEVDPNDPPIAGDGSNDDSEPEGLTTFYAYDEDLTTDNTVTLTSGASVSLDGLIAQLRTDSGLSQFFTAGSNGAATVTENPEAEFSVSLQDGSGRTVASGIVATDAGNAPITWSTVLHDRLVAVADFGDCLETSRIDALDRITKSRTDGAGRALQSEDSEGHISTITYDGNGNVLSSRDANGVGQDCVYDLRNRRAQCTDTAGTLTQTTYDKHNNVVAQTDAKGQIDTCQFDARDRRVQCTDRVKGLTKWIYDPNGNLLSLTDAEEQTTWYQYDDRNLQIKTIYPDHVPGANPGDVDYGITLCSYDGARRKLQTTDQQHDTCDYTYDLANRLLSRKYSGISFYYTFYASSPLSERPLLTDTDSFTYDAASRMLTARSDIYSNMIQFEYDQAGRKTSESLIFTNGFRQQFKTLVHYDAANQVIGYTYPDGTQVSRSYTSRSQLETLSVDGQAVDTRAYDTGGRIVGRTLGNGLTESRNYNTDNTLNEIVFGGAGSALGSYRYTWDENKNKTSETITGIMRPYGFDSTRYDSEDRLTIWNRTDGNQNQSWSLSLVGDWTNFAENGLGENRTHGPAHELQSVQNVPIAYDPKGNSHQKDGMTYSWDFGNRLYAAHDYTSAPLVFMSQLYDALGRRVCRICRGENPAGMIFVPLGQQTIADYAWNEMDVSKPTHRYIYGSYIDEPVVRLGSNDEQVYYHQNQQYSVVGLTGKSGEVLERYAYTAYGKPTILAANGLTELDNSAYANRYLYTGREWDSTIALYHYRARMYDPADGRFISRDPIGYVGSRYGLYEYVSGRSISAVDPTGLFSINPTGPFVIPFFFPSSNPTNPTIIPVLPAPTIAEQCTYAASQGSAPAAPLTNGQCPYGPNDLYAADFVMYDTDKRPCFSKCEAHTIIHRALGSSGTGGGGKCTARIAWPLVCVCKNMPNNPWSKCMRGCLACIFKKQGSGPDQEQHQACAQACYAKHPTWPAPIISDLERAIFKCAETEGVITVGGGRGTKPGPVTGPGFPDKNFDCDGCGAGPRRIRQ